MKRLYSLVSLCPKMIQQRSLSADGSSFFQQLNTVTSRHCAIGSATQFLNSHRQVTMASHQGAVLVTVASGFIATHIVDQFLRAGYAVRGSVRS